MKKNVHPQYYPDAKVTCACGNTFATGSTLPEIQVEICNQCHPFFTGKMKFIDTMGRVEKFQKKQQAAKKFVKKSDRKKLQDKKQAAQPTTLREMIQQQKKQKKQPQSKPQKPAQQ